MFELFKAECRRFRWWALAAGGLHLAVLLFFDRVMDPLQQPVMIYQLVAAFYAAVGLLLGVYQVGSYSRVNQWIALLHRPLAPRQIMIAVLGAGAVMLSAAVLVPLALFLIEHGLVGARFVDTRHWLLIGAGELLTLIGFLTGAYLALAPRRYGWLILLVALIPAKSLAVGCTALLVDAAVLAVVALMVATVFKHDLETPPKRGLALAGAAFILALGAQRAILLIGDFLFQLLWIASGTHPLNSVPPKGGIIEATRVEGDRLFDAGLAARHDPQAQVWREQVRMSEVFDLPTAQLWLPVRGELTNAAPIEFDDGERNVHWTFSHDAMAFRGVRQADLRSAGVLVAPAGFDAPPLMVGDDRMIAGDSLFSFDRDDGAIHRRIRLPGGETIVAEPSLVGDAVAVLGDRALHFFDRRLLDGTETPRPVIATVLLPAPVGGLRRLHVIELLDGYLVSFTYGRDAVDGPAVAWQRIVEVDASGRVHTVANRPLHPDFPIAARFATYWLSPALNGVRSVAETVGSGDVPEWAHEPIRIPRGIWVAAALLSLAAAGVAAMLARKRRLPRRDALAWTVATLLLGPPMLLVFWLIRPRQRA